MEQHRRPGDLDDTALAAGAARALRGNSNAAGTMTRAAPQLYPHQWSWDAAFVAVGLAHLDVGRALAELDTLFSGQWQSGLLPHIVFDPTSEGYFPGPDRWGCREVSADPPEAPATSGICQPPVHALAVERIVAIAERRGADDVAAVEAWLPRAYEHLLAWHRYLARARDPEGTGLLAVVHGWESGMDNSPRWDGPYARVVVGDDLPPYVRRDLAVVSDASERPTTAEYDRYLWLVEELRRARYDDAQVRATASFLVTDVFMTAVLASADDALARLARRLWRPEADELEADAARFRHGVVAAVDDASGLALDTDLRTGEVQRVETVAGLAPLLLAGSSSTTAARARSLELLASPRWTAHPELRWPVIPSTSPASPDFRPRTYWRGPTWPVMTWFVAWMLDQQGDEAPAAGLRSALLDELRDGTYAEYHEPITGEPLGSADQSWTAAAALDLLHGPWTSRA